jgi:DNA-binding NarL/FixJ family response regulator
MARLRIFLADDHQVVREGLRALISTQNDMEVVGEAADGRSACEQALAARSQVVIMDASMPVMGGAEATETLKRADPTIKVLALTVHEDRTCLKQFLDAGASGYLPKRVVAEELIRAVRTVAEGGTYLDPAVVGTVLTAFSRGKPATATGPAAELSDREEEVLRLVARGHTNRAIASRLDLSTKTVELYRARSMEKLGLTSRVEIVEYAVRRGWLLDPSHAGRTSARIGRGCPCRPCRALIAPKTISLV